MGAIRNKLSENGLLVGVISGVLVTLLGGWFTVGRTVVTEPELETRVQEVVDSTLAVLIVRVADIEPMRSSVQEIREEVAVLNARTESIQRQLDRLEDKLDEHARTGSAGSAGSIVPRGAGIQAPVP